MREPVTGLAPRPSWCNSCLRETQHVVLHAERHTQTEGEWGTFETLYLVVQCGGCHTTGMREELTSDLFDPGEVQITYCPSRLWARPPGWLRDIEAHDPGLHALLLEVYSATNDRQLRLLSMGVRTVLDYVMGKIVEDVGGFESRLDAMVQRQHLTPKQRDMLRVVIEAGSAAAHRGYKPPLDLLEQMLLVMETIVRDHYVTGPMLTSAMTVIPPRPPRGRRSKAKNKTTEHS